MTIILDKKETKTRNLSKRRLCFSVMCACFFSVLFYMDFSSGRNLSISYGDGKCLWQPPHYNVPADLDWVRTLVAGFPSGDKRLVFMQMEALTGWSSRDEWAYEVGEMSNHPFIKSNYPHFEGAWGWEGKRDFYSCICNKHACS